MKASAFSRFGGFRTGLLLLACVSSLPTRVPGGQAWQWQTLGEGGGPGGRGYAVVAWTGKILLVWGGRPFGLNMPWLGDGWRYDPNSDVWSPMSADNAPVARQFPVGVWTGRELVIWGGTSPSTRPTACARAHVTILPPIPGTPCRWTTPRGSVATTP